MSTATNNDHSKFGARGILYDNLVADGYDFGGYEAYTKAIDTPSGRRTLYDNLLEDGYELDDYERFSGDLTASGRMVNGRSAGLRKEESRATAQPQPTSTPQTEAPNAAGTEDVDAILNGESYKDAGAKDSSWRDMVTRAGFGVSQMPKQRELGTDATKWGAENPLFRQSRQQSGFVEPKPVGKKENGFANFVDQDGNITTRYVGEEGGDYANAMEYEQQSGKMKEAQRLHEIEDLQKEREQLAQERSTLNAGIISHDKFDYGHQTNLGENTRRIEEIDARQAEINERLAVLQRNERELVKKNLKDLKAALEPTKESDAIHAITHSSLPYQEVDDNKRDRWLRSSARHNLDEIDKLVKQAEEGKGQGFFMNVASGLFDAILNTRTWDFGMQDLADYFMQQGIVAKYDKEDKKNGGSGNTGAAAVAKLKKGETLTEAEDLYLRSVLLRASAEGLFSGDLTRGYKAGKVTGEALPFMLEMYVNPLSAGNKTATSTVGKYASIFGRQRARQVATTFAKATTKGNNVVTRGLNRLARNLVLDTDAVIRSTGMAFTSGAPRVIGGTVSDMTGELRSTYDSNGDIQFAGTENEYGFWEAFLKNTYDIAKENATEMGIGPVRGIIKNIELPAMGRAIQRVAGNTKAGRYIGEMLSKVTPTTWNHNMNHFLKRTQWHGTIAEYWEEVEGNVADGLMSMLTNGRIGGDTNFRLDLNDKNSIFNLDNNIDTFLGVALLGGFTSAVNTLGYRGAKSEAQKRLTASEAECQRVFGNLWSAYKEDLDALNTGKDANGISGTTRYIIEGLQSGMWTDEGKKAVCDYLHAREFAAGVELGGKAENREVDAAIKEELDNEIHIGYPEQDDAAGAMADPNLTPEAMAAADNLIDGNIDGSVSALLKDANEATVNAVDRYMRARAKDVAWENETENAINEQVEAERAKVEQVAIRNDEGAWIYPVQYKGRNYFIKDTDPVAGTTVLMDAEDGSLLTLGVNDPDIDGTTLQSEGILMDDYLNGIRSNLEAERDAYMTERSLQENNNKNTVLHAEVGAVVPTLNGNKRVASVDEQGNFYLEDDTMVMDEETGQMVPKHKKEFTEEDKVTEEQFRQMQNEYWQEQDRIAAETAAEMQGEQETEEENGSVDSNSDNNIGNGDTTLGDAMPMIGEGEDAEPDFMAVPAERTYKWITEESGYPKEVAQQLVEAKKKEAEDALKKAQKGEPMFGDKKVGTNTAKYNRLHKEWEESVNAAQQAVDYWNAVSGMVSAETPATAQAQQPAQAALPQNEQAAAPVQKAQKTSSGKSGKKSLTQEIAELGEPQNLREFIMNAIFNGGVKFIWNNGDSKTRGLSSHLGLNGSEKERKRRLWMLANKEKGGVTPEEAAEQILQDFAAFMNWSGIESDWQYDSQDVFNELLDIIKSYDTKSMMAEGIKETHRTPDQILSEEEEYQQEEFARSEGFDTFAEWDAYESGVDTLFPQFTEEEWQDFYEQEYEYYANRRTEERNEQGNEVLSGQEQGDNEGSDQVTTEQGGDAQVLGSLRGDLSQGAGAGQSGAGVSVENGSADDATETVAGLEQTDDYLKPRNAEEEGIIANTLNQLQSEIDAAVKVRDKAAADLQQARVRESNRATDLFGNDDVFNQQDQLFGNSEMPIDRTPEGVERRVRAEREAFNEAQAALDKLQSAQERNSRIRGALDTHRRQTSFLNDGGQGETLIKGEKWNKTGEPEPFKSKGKKGYSHDVFFELGRKKYGITKADSDTEEVLQEDFGSHIGIWNAYEQGNILLSPELAAAIKAKIEYEENNKVEKKVEKSDNGRKREEIKALFETNNIVEDSSFIDNLSDAEVEELSGLISNWETVNDEYGRVQEEQKAALNSKDKKKSEAAKKVVDAAQARANEAFAPVEDFVKERVPELRTATSPNGVTYRVGEQYDIIDDKGNETQCKITGIDEGGNVELIIGQHGNSYKKTVSAEKLDEYRERTIENDTRVEVAGFIDNAVDDKDVSFVDEITSDELNQLKRLIDEWYFYEMSADNTGKKEETWNTLTNYIESLRKEYGVEEEQPLYLSDLAKATGIKITKVEVKEDGSTVIAEEEKKEKKEKKEKSGYGSDNKLVSADRYEELKKRMQEKLRGQMNMGVDPEILAIGVEMAAYHIEAGARKFADFAKQMIDDLGDAIRPYLKAFYNGARDLPELEGIADEMTSYDEVKGVDVLTIGKEVAGQPAVNVNFVEHAKEVSKEEEVEKQATEAKEKIRKESKKRKKSAPTGQGDLFGAVSEAKPVRKTAWWRDPNRPKSINTADYKSYMTDEAKEYFANFVGTDANGRVVNFTEWAHPNLAYITAAAWDGVSIPVNELMAIPEIQEADVRSSNDKSLNISDAEKEQHVQRLLDDEHGSAVFDNGKIKKVDGVEDFSGAVKQERKAFLVIGRPAGGKSSVFANPLSNKYGARIIDSDVVKPWLEGYNEGYGAGYVQKASADVATAALEIASERGDNIILPRVGGSSVIKDVIKLREKGYEVQLYWNQVSEETSIMRAASRFAENGRYLSLKYLSGIGDKVSKTFINFAEKKLGDYYAEQGTQETNAERTPNRTESNTSAVLGAGGSQRGGAEPSRSGESGNISDVDDRGGQDRRNETERGGQGVSEGERIFSYVEWKSNDVPYGEKPKEIWNSKNGKELPLKNTNGYDSRRENPRGISELSLGAQGRSTRSTDRGGVERGLQDGRSEPGRNSQASSDVNSGDVRPVRQVSQLEPVTNPKNLRNNHGERGKDYAPKSVDARIEANIKAIELMQQLIESGEQATPEQMAVLRQFSGWGGLGKAFAKPSPYLPLDATATRLRTLLGEEAYEQANMSRNSAYYTPVGIIDTLWDIARAMGFRGGNVLEGSAGIGSIIGQMPTDMSERSNIHAVEIDQTTGNILSLLYPDAKVDVQGFEATEVENCSIDLAITNVPFVTGLRVNDTTGDKDLSKKFHDIHDFCIAKNIRKLREGGIGIFITSSGTLDNSQKLRTWMVQEGNCDVVGAFRLNNETFGGAGVTSDIIVVRKRVNGKKSANAIDVLDVTGVRTAEYDTGETKRIKGKEVPVIKRLSMDYNSYFVEHPEMMAGEMKFGFEEGNNYRPTSKGLYPVKGKNQGEMMKAWLDGFKDKDWEEVATEQQGTQPDEVYEKLGEGVKEGSLIESNGKLCVAQRGKAVPLAVNANKVKGKTKLECFKAYKSIKDALSKVLDYQIEHDSDEGLKPLLAALNKSYDDFVKTYGHFHKNTAISFLKNDVDFANIFALETYSETKDMKGNITQNFGKAQVFKQRVVEKDKEPEPKSVKDGVLTSLFVHGKIDLAWIADKLGKSEEEVKSDIIKEGLGFENPISREVEVYYEYLSGNVREKLRQAEEQNTDGRYDSNIKALKAVIPLDIPAHLIDFSIGSSWIDPKLYEEYIQDRTGISVKLTSVGGTWSMETPYYISDQKNVTFGVRSELLHKTIMGTSLIEAAMQNRTVTVSESHKRYDGTTETITDKEATQACANKIDEIRQDFKDWARDKMRSDAEMSERIERTYNDMFNNYVAKEIPDEFVPDRFPGATMSIKLNPHQGKAAVRGITQPLLLAHEVGSGKTFTLITTAMEMRRLGTARKPMIVVQNATVGQFVESAKYLYPNAKVLTIEEKDLTGEGRKNFYAKIKYNDWDMIVVPQSVLERIPDSEERQMAFVYDKIEEKMLVLEQMKESDERGNSMIVRQAEKEVEKLEAELADLTDKMKSKRKEKDEKRAAVTRQNAEVRAMEMLDREVDDVENFDDMGIDALLVDEAHEYKHLGFATAMQRGVKGVDPSYSKKAQGVFLKTQAILEKNNGRNVVFATGTPISNTAAEIWTFMRYLMPADTMKEYGIYYFDDFVRNFGNLTQMLEFTTSGKFKENNRFAGYVNLPELVRIWSGVADTVTNDQIEKLREEKGEEKAIPKMEGDKAQDIYLPQTRALRSVMKFVKGKLEEYDKMTGKQKKENSHIPLTMYGIAKAAAVDARLVVSDAEDEPQSKTNEAVRQTLRSLEETKSYKGTVALFADNYQNKRSGFNLYEDIRKKLIEAGVPEEQIVIMKSGMSVKKKLEIFEKVNRGEIRVIMGSTFTLGTGVNIQERLHTLIHLDAPNRPMDYTQRNGRILRQGNLHKEWGIPVRVLRFGVEDSLDVTAYQRLKTKGAIADSIMNGAKLLENSMENRTMEEEEDVFGDTVAQLSGSEYAMLKNQAEKDVKKYEAKKKQYEYDQAYIHKEIPNVERTINYLKDTLKKAQDNLAIVEGMTGVSITVGKNKFGSVDAMADFIKEYNKQIKDAENELREKPSIDTQKRQLTVNVNGIDFVFTTELSIETKREGGTLFTAIHRKMTYACGKFGIEEAYVKQSLLREGLEDIVNNVISGKDFREEIERAQGGISRNESQLAQMKDRYGKPFEFEEELKKSHERYDEYAELMKKEMDEKDKKYKEMDAETEDISDVTEASEAEEDEEGEDEVLMRESDEETLPKKVISILEDWYPGFADAYQVIDYDGVPELFFADKEAAVELYNEQFPDANVTIDEDGNIQGGYHYPVLIWGVKEFESAMRGLSNGGSVADLINGAVRDAMKEAEQKRDDFIESENFKRYFGDWEDNPEQASKVVDAEGKPAILYHGTNLSRTNDGKPFWVFYEGTHFGTPGQSSDVTNRGVKDMEISKIYPVYLNIRNPKRVSDTPAYWEGSHSEWWKKQIALAKKEGYDGIVYLNKYEDKENPADSWIAFYPEQIKSATENVGTFNSEEQDIRLREVSDEEKVDWLERQPKVKVYRSMVLRDGKLYPPMSSKEAEGKQMRQPSEIGKWEEAEEAPEKAVLKNGKWVFPLRKDNGKMLYAAYNPYIHTSRTMLNDQFSEAQDRDNLVVVEMEVPASELTGGYKAKRAKDSVGTKQWKAGPIQGQLNGTREVILTRWAKPVRIVPVEEVADHIAKMIEGQVEVMPTNVVTPQQRAALEQRGVKFVETDNTGKIVEGENKGKTWASVYGNKNKSAAFQREGDADWTPVRTLKSRRYTKAEQGKHAERTKAQMQRRAEDMAKKLHIEDRVTIVDSVDDVKGLTPAQRENRKNAKGWFEPSTGRIVIVLGNHRYPEDVTRTVLHEAVAHYGLRELFGENFDTFLDNVYNAADEDVRGSIDVLVERYKGNRRKATEEYLALLAQNEDFENAQHTGWWQKLKKMFLDLLRKVGIKTWGDQEGEGWLTDNELRYILWRSYENLAEPGMYRNPWRNPVARAKDVQMQSKLKVGEFEEDVAKVAENNPGANASSTVTRSKSNLPERMKSFVSMSDVKELTFEQKDKILDLYRSIKTKYGMDTFALIETPVGYVMINTDARNVSEKQSFRQPFAVVSEGNLDKALQTLIGSGRRVAMASIEESSSVREDDNIRLVEDSVLMREGDEIGEHVKGIRKKYDLRGAAMTNVIGSRAELESLKDILSDSIYNAVLKDYEKEGSTGIYFPETDMLFVFSDKCKDIKEGEMTWWHELTHGFWHTLSKDLQNRYGRACVEYLKRLYPETLEEIEKYYSDESINNEACSFAVEKIIEEFGVEKFLTANLAGNEEIANFVGELRNYLINGKERKTNNQPRRETQEGEGRRTTDEGDDNLSRRNNKSEREVTSDRRISLPTNPVERAKAISEMKNGLALLQNDGRKTEMDAKVQEIGGSLSALRKAMRLQREFDREGVKELTDLVNDMLKDGSIDSVSAFEIKRILTNLRNSVGKTDMSNEVRNIMDIIANGVYKKWSERLNKVLNTKTVKTDSNGVAKQGSVDIRTQAMFKTMREGMRMSEDGLRALIAERLDENLWDEKTQGEIDGYSMALTYQESVKSINDDIASLQSDLRNLTKRYKDKEIDGKYYNECKKSIQETLIEARIDAAEKMWELYSQLGNARAEGMEGARAFRTERAERKKMILHYANSDMLGVSTATLKAKGDKNWKEKFVGNSFTRFLLQPLATFDTMLRMFGRRSLRGEGYLFNHFMRGTQQARMAELNGRVAAKEQLKEKISEVFGKKMNWDDAYKLTRKPLIDVEVFDGESKSTKTLTVGNALYIYAVNKMKDGEMKLRKMGVSEEDVENIETKLRSLENGNKLIELIDWVQDDFFTSLQKKYNKVHERVFGASMASIPNYFPLRIVQGEISQDVDVSSADIDFGMPSTITGSIIERKRNTKPLDILNADAFETVLQHVDEMEHWAAFAELNQDVNTLLSSKRFKSQVMNMTTAMGTGRQMWNEFVQCAQLAVGSHHPANEKSSIDKVVVNIAKGATASKIAFRPYTAFKQLLSAPAFWSEASLTKLAENFWTAQGESWRWCMENLPTFRERVESRTIGETRLMANESDWSIWKDDIVKKLSRAGMALNVFVDAMTCAVGAYSVYQTRYNMYMDYGYSIEDAVDKAKEDASRSFNESQQSTEGAFINRMQTDKTVMAVIGSIFRNASMAYTRKVYMAYEDLKNRIQKGKNEDLERMTKQFVRDGLTEEQAARAAKKEYNRAIRTDIADLAIYGVVLEIFWNAAPKIAPFVLTMIALSGAGDGDDDNKEKERLEKELKKMIDTTLIKSLFGTVEGLTFGNWVTDNIEAMASRDEDEGIMQALKDGTLPTLPFAKDIDNMIKSFDKSNYQGFYDMARLLITAGVGADPQTISDAYVAIMDAANGDMETGKEVVLAVMRALQFPNSATEQAYFYDMKDDKGKVDVTKVKEFAKRYVEYKEKKDMPLFNALIDEETKKKNEERYMKSFDKKLRRYLGDDVADLNNYYKNSWEKNENRKDVAAVMDNNDIVRAYINKTEKNELKKVYDEWQRLGKWSTRENATQYFNEHNLEIKRYMLLKNCDNVIQKILKDTKATGTEKLKKIREVWERL